MTKRFIVDTNVMLRYILNDDVNQSRVAQSYLNNPNHECILSMQMLCEVVWVLKTKMKATRQETIIFLEKIVAKNNMIFNKFEYDLGMYFLKSGGDFADGVIAYQVSQFNNARLLTFDKDARKIAKRLNIAVEEM